MAAQVPLAQLAAGADAVEFSGYAYPSGSIYAEVIGRDAAGTIQKWHEIGYFGSSFSASDFNNAPIGSKLTNFTAGAVKLYIKTAASTWTVVGAQS